MVNSFEQKHWICHDCNTCHDTQTEGDICCNLQDAISSDFMNPDSLSHLLIPCCYGMRENEAVQVIDKLVRDKLNGN